MNLIIWLAPNVWVFTAQLVEQWIADAEVKEMNPAEFEISFQELLKLR